MRRENKIEDDKFSASVIIVCSCGMYGREKICHVCTYYKKELIPIIKMELQNHSAVNPKQIRKVNYGCHSYKNAKIHPVIRLAGKYLEGFDFNIGDSIEVSIDKGKISIEKIENRTQEMEQLRENKNKKSKEIAVEI
jgi:antitoxin component of MazEF toxin-antitoxin module